MIFQLSSKEVEILRESGVLEGDLTEDKLCQILHSLVKEKGETLKSKLKPLPLKMEDLDEDDEKYYQKILDDIDSGKDIDSYGSKLLDCEVYKIEGDDHRWTREMTSYCLVKDRYFCLEWGKGLTEMQENEYYSVTEVVYKGVKNKLSVSSEHVFEDLKHN
jgi:hypothetical protein